VIVLGEDQHHEMLVYKYLRRRGLEPRDIRIRTCPSGQESANGWVLSNFAAETREYRKRQAARGETALTVMIDADDRTVEKRLAQLDQALANGREKKIRKHERIVRLVPKRNVETWILCLTSGRELNEDTDYKRGKHKWHDLIPTAAGALREWTRPKAALPAHCVSSLRVGVQELKRLDY
jgi:hypothetical protein